MIVLLHAYHLGFTAWQTAVMFTLYEVAGVVTNLLAGLMGARWGIKSTLLTGLALQLCGIGLLLGWQDAWAANGEVTKGILFVTAAQMLCGVAKDLTKLGGKTVTKLVTPDERESRLFKVVSFITGFKNSMKGVGYFIGAAALTFNYYFALGILVLLVLAAMPWAVVGLSNQLGRARKENIKLSVLFRQAYNVNVLSVARFFLFGSRDMWFEVQLPFFLRDAAHGFGWERVAVGAVLAGHHPSTKNTACSGRVASCFTLPTPMLVHVLSYLQPAQRLGKAALVCRAWREAANAATSSIAYTFDWADYDASKRQLASMTAWLERGAAQQVTSINLDYGWGEDEDVCLEVSLPLQQLCKLRSLRLISFDLLEEPPLCSSSSSSSIAGINPLAAMSSSLTALELYDVTLHSFNSMPELFRCMASLSQLQRLELTSVRVEPPTDSFAELMSNRRRGSCSSAYTYTLADALCQMPQLTRLQLDVQTECQLRWKHSPGPMGAAIAGLQQLQQLELSTLDVPKAAPHTLFMQLPASITKLHVGRACVTFTPAETPGLARLTALRDLKLMRVLGMDPAVLCSSAGTLTQLQLGLAWDNRSLSALVRMLPHLQQLQSVWLYHNPYGDDRDAEPPAPQLSADDCALLLSPAKLTSLTVSGISFAPGGAGRMFKAKGAALRVFGLSTGRQQPPIDLSSLAKAWPQLQQLQLSGAPAEQASWPALRQLTALSSLSAGDSKMSDATLQELAALTRLKSLTLSSCANVTGVGLLHLTQLTGLTKLNIYESDLKGWGAEVLKTMRECGIQLQSKASQPLWQQLYNLCRDHNIECVWELLEEQEELVEQQAQQLQQQALQLQDAQLRVMQLQQQLAAAGAGGIMLGALPAGDFMQQHLAAAGAGPASGIMLPAVDAMQQQLAAARDGGIMLGALPAGDFMQPQLAAAGAGNSSSIVLPAVDAMQQQQLAAAGAGGIMWGTSPAGDLLQQQLAAAGAGPAGGIMLGAMPADLQQQLDLLYRSRHCQPNHAGASTAEK